MLSIVLNIVETLEYFGCSCSNGARTAAHVVFHRLTTTMESCDLVDQSIALTQCYACCDLVGVAVNAVRVPEIMGRDHVHSHNQPLHDVMSSVD